jgi:hypothetical protein
LPLAALVIDGMDAQRLTSARRVSQSAWAVANLTLDHPPIEQGMAGPAWDNVLFGTPSLGYVIATHQTIRVQPGATVLTWYRPLAEHAPEKARAMLQSNDWRYWARAALTELQRPHPDLAQRVQQIDVWRWPHAMVRPTVGAVWNDAPRSIFEQPWRGIHFVHTDVSGVSLFEEAVERGGAAADVIIDR